MKKSEIRRSISKVFSFIDKAKIISWSFDIFQKTCSFSFLKDANSIGLYCSTEYEVQTNNLINCFLKQNKIVSIPKVISENEFTFKQILKENDLQRGYFDILEPQGSCNQVSITDIDVVILPCRAVDIFGNRVGYGKGFYDRFLNTYFGIKVCLAFDFQVYPFIISQEHDQNADYTVTQTRIIDHKFNLNNNYKKIINGVAQASFVFEKYKNIVFNNKIKPTLAVVFVGDNHASRTYVQAKEKKCKDIGVDVVLEHTVSDISQNKLLEKISFFNNNKAIDGILIQLPLPEKLDTRKIINEIVIDKDVDCLTEKNRTLLNIGKQKFVPCTPKGILNLLSLHIKNFDNKKIVLVGNGFLVNNPLYKIFYNKKINCIVCDKSTKDISKYTKYADIIISATGVANIINSTNIKKNVILIDAGTTFYNNRTVGDIDFLDVIDSVGLITPVPCGVGPMTVAMLAVNVVESYILKHLSCLDKSDIYSMNFMQNM